MSQITAVHGRPINGGWSRRCALLGALSTVLLAGPVRAQVSDRTTIAVLPFNGPNGSQVQADIVRLLRRSYEIIPDSTWDAAASKLFATSRSAEDLAAVATTLNAAVIITGAIKRDPSWTLIVTVRHGQTGESFEKLRLPLRSSRIDNRTMRQVGSDLPLLIEQALAHPPPPPMPPEPEIPVEAPASKMEEESPLAKKAEEPPPARPKWAPYIDGMVALALVGRNFAFGDAALPQFHSSVTAGLRIDVTGYPLAFLAKRPGPGFNAAQGLGLGLTADIAFWPDSIPCNRDASNSCQTTSERYSTTEYRLETGLRWHWNVLNRPNRPELLLSVEYGRHVFSIEKKADGTDVGPPDILYQYVTFGLGTRLPVGNYVAVLVNFHYHLLLDTGAIHTASEYGPGGGWGIRVLAGVEVLPWRGLVLRLAGFYEHFGLSFDHPPTPTGGATDQYYGGLLGIGYVY